MSKEECGNIQTAMSFIDCTEIILAVSVQSIQRIRSKIIIQ